MNVVRSFLFFPIAFSLVRANGEGKTAEATPAGTSTPTEPKAAEAAPKAVDAAAVTFKQYLDFVMQLNEAVTLREEDTKKKLLVNFPLFGAPPFDGAWGDLKDLLKKVTELRALLLKDHTFGLPVTTTPEKQPPDAGKAVGALFDFIVGVATDAATVADKATRAVTGMDPDKAVGFHVTPATADSLFEFVPDLYEKLKDLHTKVGEWVEITSTFDDKKMVTHAGDHRPKHWLRQGGFTNEEVKGDTALGTLKAKLDELVGPTKPCEKVLCTLASYALMKTPEDAAGKQARLFLLASAMHNDAMKEKVKVAVNAVTPGKGETFVNQLKEVGKSLQLPKEQVPKQYRFPGVYANLDVQHFWTVLTGVFGTILTDLEVDEKDAQGKAGQIATRVAELVKVEGPLHSLTVQVAEMTKAGVGAGGEAPAQAAAGTAGARAEAPAKEGQGEDGAHFCGIGMTVFFVSVVIVVF
uniref:p50 n=1 Tax=Babesia gibsoni TaxID=33632 RepID=A8DMR7_BABGI|nr:P50 [Babesia gibsoni]